MSKPAIEVIISGGGRVANGELHRNEATRATCSLCATDVEAATSLAGGAYACAACLRERLDALSVARFRMFEGKSQGLPWGKVSG